VELDFPVGAAGADGAVAGDAAAAGAVAATPAGAAVFCADALALEDVELGVAAPPEAGTAAAGAAAVAGLDAGAGALAAPPASAPGGGAGDSALPHPAEISDKPVHISATDTQLERRFMMRNGSGRPFVGRIGADILA